jgi:hypothetical protein
MFMQIFSRIALIGLIVLSTSCSPSKEAKQAADKSLEQLDKAGDKEAAADGKIDCAVSGQKELTRSCLTEKISGADGQSLIIRHANGGFRRFKILTDGRGLQAAEGAEKLAITLLDGGKIEVVVAGDRYQLPAQIKASKSDVAK